MAKFYSVIFMFCLSTSAFANLSFSIEKKDINFGKLQYAIVMNDKTVKVFKNTNKFDLSKDIGEFILVNKDSFKKDFAIFKRHYLALVKISKLTQTSPPSENSFKHQNYIKLGEYIVHPNDDYYPKLKRTIGRILKSAKLKPIKSLQTSGINTKNCSKLNDDGLVCLSKQFGVLFK